MGLMGLMGLLWPMGAQAQISIGGNVYGGGNLGDVDGNTTVTVYEGDLNNVFGGARMANVGGHAFTHIDGEHASSYVLINNVYGGNDISGNIGTKPVEEQDDLPTELTGVETKTGSGAMTEAKKNDIDKSWDAFVRITSNVTDGTQVGKVYIGQLFGGGNGDYDYTSAKLVDPENPDDPDAPANPYYGLTKPELGKTYLEVVGGSIVYAFGGGNNATVTEKTVIYVDNPSKVVNSIIDATNPHAGDGGELLTTKRIYEMGYNPGFTQPTSDAFQIGCFFGGNNKAPMSIRPTWNLQSGLIRNLYSGGNKGDMISPDGLILDINPDPTKTFKVDKVFGGCRMADVHPARNGVEGDWIEGAALDALYIDEDDYKMSREQIRHHLRRSRQYLAVKDMKKALEECEVVLVNDPSNQDAIRIREAIERKRKVILQQERVASRDGIIADVDAAWRPPYAVNVAQLADRSAETVKSQQGDSEETTVEQDIEKRMKDMRLPTISFKPPATIIDAVDFFRGASRDYDRPDIPLEKRGFNFVLRTPQGAIKGQQHAAEGEGGGDDFSSSGNEEENSAAPANGLDPIPTITASDVSFHEALTLVCESVGYKFIINGPIVMVMPKDMSTAEILSRKYNVPESFMERVSSATDEMKQMGGSSFGGGQKKSNDSDEESPERDWKAFFEEMGVKWPEGSSIKHIKSLGKLYVRNTRENLAEFEKVLEELGGQPQLIEIETRFVEVSQEDLNSLGFEWILNSDYSLNLGNTLGKALGVSPGVWGNESGSVTTSRSGSNATYYDSLNREANQQSQEAGFPTSWARRTEISTSDSTASSYSHTVSQRSSGGNWIRWREGDPVSKKRALGINAFGGTSEQQNGNRYLSTLGNHISGESKSTNDQFMRVNAFLGQADLSMILHMLSQRSDTDLLSAPKVVTKSGENAVIKVVTEYIYPQDYEVQLLSSSSGSGSGSSGSQSAILAVVEPQNFTMREVGVILDVTPTYSEANGGTIDLELKPQVVDEPTWRNYGMRLPFTGNTSSGTMADIGSIFEGMSTALNTIGAQLTSEETSQMARQVVDSAMDSAANVSSSSSSTMTWYDAPMEQPFFHVRSIDSKVSITPGATVVMGGLITEQRKAMDDKIPFLGDLPYIGRLFRSHAEQTIKRNLLIFVTGRLITPAGRELRIGEETAADEAEVKPAPEE